MVIRCAVFGCGHWGRNFVRILRNTSGVDLVCVVDSADSTREEVQQTSPGLAVVTPSEILGNDDMQLDAAVIATPAHTHGELVAACLDRGWHVLVEKPFTTDSAVATRLAMQAETSGLVLMLGHTFLYNPAVQRMKELYDEGVVGEAYYLHARRTHLGLIRDDVNAVWDLAPHDVAIMQYLLGTVPSSVSAVGEAFLKPGREDVAFITMSFPKGVKGNIFVSWADSHKVRELQLVGSRGRMVFNDLESLERIKVYEKGVAANVDPDGFGEYQLSLRDGSIYSPNVAAREPLRVEVDHFLRCVRNDRVPISDAWSGVEVVRVLEAIDQSIRADGAPVEVIAAGQKCTDGFTAPTEVSEESLGLRG